jgi:Flp pilus assembly protein TadB
LYRHIAAQLFVIGCCGTGIALAGDPSQRAAFIAALLWALAGMYAMHRGMWSPALPGDAALTTSLEYYRGEVERQVILSRRYLGWLFGPVVLFLAAITVPLVMMGVRDPALLPKMLPFLTLLVLWFGAVFVLRVRTQRELQREIEQLNRS